MNIQIFGTKKSFDSKKAERYFRERGIKYQFVDMKEKGLSKGEFNSVCQAVGGYEKLIDENCKDKDLLALIKYIAEEDRAEKILENSGVLSRYLSEMPDMYLQIKFEKGELTMVTGITHKEFTMDKTLDRGWDDAIREWIRTLKISAAVQ